MSRWQLEEISGWPEGCEGSLGGQKDREVTSVPMSK